MYFEGVSIALEHLFDYDDFRLEGYDPHPHIKGEVSV